MAAGRPARAARQPGVGRASRTGEGKRPSLRRVPGGRPPGRPLTRAERRRAAKVRRARLGFAISAAVAVAVVGAWFPASELTHQRQQLATATTQLDQLRQQDKALAQEQKRLDNPAEVARIAREQYQLVNPQTTPYQVLPKTDASTSSGNAYPTDPGLAKPVTPSGDVELPPGAMSSRSASRTGGGTSSSFLGRILQTLEFWR